MTRFSSTAKDAIAISIVKKLVHITKHPWLPKIETALAPAIDQYKLKPDPASEICQEEEAGKEDAINPKISLVIVPSPAAPQLLTTIDGLSAIGDIPLNLGLYLMQMVLFL
jgi:hypothetical protein